MTQKLLPRPARHADHFGIGSGLHPELEQYQIRGFKHDVRGARRPIIEDVFVENAVQMGERDAERLRSFLLGIDFSKW